MSRFLERSSKGSGRGNLPGQLVDLVVNLCPFPQSNVSSSSWELPLWMLCPHKLGDDDAKTGGIGHANASWEMVQ